MQQTQTQVDPIHLPTVMVTVDGPVTEVFTVVGVHVVAVFTQSAASSGNRLSAAEMALQVVATVQGATIAKLGQAGFHQGPGLKSIDPASVVHHQPITDVKAVMAVAGATHPEVVAGEQSIGSILSQL